MMLWLQVFRTLRINIFVVKREMPYDQNMWCPAKTADFLMLRGNLFHTNIPILGVFAMNLVHFSDELSPF